MSDAILGAEAMHEAACKPFDSWPRDRRLARPFGVPEGMPEHRWLVSGDVLQALYNAAPPPHGPNPKNGDDGTRRLFGWPVDVDATLAPGTMRLLIDGRTAVQPPETP